MVIVGTLILAFGISLYVVENVVMNSGEAFVKALADTFHQKFGNLKIAFDVCCVIAAVVLSFIFFGLHIQGTREGTVIAALCTGFFVKFFLKYIDKPVTQILVR